MIRLSNEVKNHWWHRLYLVIIWPLGVVSIIAIPLSILQYYRDQDLIAKSSGSHNVDTLVRAYNDCDSVRGCILFFVLAWPILFVFYRILLFVVIGGKAFARKERD